MPVGTPGTPGGSRAVTGFADPGYLDGKARYPLHTSAHVKRAWAAVNSKGISSKYKPHHVSAMKKRISSAGRKYKLYFNPVGGAMGTGPGVNPQQSVPGSVSNPSSGGGGAGASSAADNDIDTTEKDVQPTHADPGYQVDKRRRFPLHTAKHVKRAWKAIQSEKAKKHYSPEQLKKMKASIRQAGKKYGVWFPQGGTMGSTTPSPQSPGQAYTTPAAFAPGSGPLPAGAPNMAAWDEEPELLEVVERLAREGLWQ